MVKLATVTTLFLSVIVYFTAPVFAVEQKYVERVLKRAAYHVKIGSPYVWGKTDCSGTMYDIYFSAGIPVLRSTAYNMSKGLEGWKNKDVDRKDAVPADLVFWNVRNYKPSMGKLEKNHPHVGLKTSSSTIAHASGGRRYFLEDPIESPWGKKIEYFRRLTFKDDAQK